MKTSLIVCLISISCIAGNAEDSCFSKADKIDTCTENGGECEIVETVPYYKAYGQQLMEGFKNTTYSCGKKKFTNGPIVIYLDCGGLLADLCSNKQ